jgi:hypothetical protein
MMVSGGNGTGDLPAAMAQLQSPLSRPRCDEFKVTQEKSDAASPCPSNASTRASGEAASPFTTGSGGSDRRVLLDVGETLEPRQLLFDETVSAASEKFDELPPTRVLFLSMLCIFQGYAVMVGPCQQKFKSALHVEQFGARASMFTQAVDFVHWGKFIMRVGHNAVLGCISPRKRVLVAMSLLFVGCLIPPLVVFTFGSDWIGNVFLSYGLSGMGIGISECTFLSVITPLGAQTKSWAIAAVPVGFGLINIAGMICTSLGVPVELLYWYVVAWIPIGMCIFCYAAPREHEVQASAHRQSSLKEAFEAWRSWLPRMTPCLIAKVLVNFAMENITPVSFYTFNAAYVPMLSPAATTTLMDHDLYFALLALVTLVANVVSQHVAYKMKFTRYSSLIGVMACACAGGLVCCYLVSLKIAAVNLGAVFLAFWVNGTVYGASSIFIDRFVPKQYNLVAYSCWCMIGDLGPILGGAMMDVLRGWICGGVVYTFTCRSDN